MSWYSDREPFDEHDPDYCKNCDGGDSYEECRKCMKRHEEAERERTDYESTDE